MKKDKQRIPLLVIAGTSLILALSGCFDWQVPDDYEPWSDGDADGDVDGDVDGDADGDGDGDLWHGDPCWEHWDCAEGLACTWSIWDERRHCRVRCPSGMECQDIGLGVHSVCTSSFEGADAVCTIDCDLESSAGCPEDSHCQFELLGDAPPFLSGTTCMESFGFGGQGDPCFGTTDCDNPYLCIPLSDVEGYCMRVCYDLGVMCEGGGECVDAEVEMLDSTPIGLCFPPL